MHKNSNKKKEEKKQERIENEDKINCIEQKKLQSK